MPPDLDEIKMQLLIPPVKSFDSASPSVISSSVPDAATVDDDQLKQVELFRGKISEKPSKLILCGNASIEQEVSRHHTCNTVTIFQGDENDPDYTRNNERCGIPEHLLFDILLWLPVISLLRFKSVCKSWCSLIDSSLFITKHCDHNRCKDSLLANYDPEPYPYYDYSTRKFCLVSGSKYEEFSDLGYVPHWYSDVELIVSSSCNGIVCLVTDTNRNVALWNPAMKQIRPLSESLVVLQWPTPFESFDFCFDVKSNDYKVVKIHFYLEHNFSGTVKSKCDCIVEVYSLRTDSWKIIQDVLPVKEIYLWRTINKDGKCFWIGFADQYSAALISFDLSDEIFETLPMPGERSHPDCYSLDFLGDRFVYMKAVDLDLFPPNFHPMYFDIWVLEEYGGKKSWNKLCKLGPTCDGCMDGCYPLFFSENGEFLVFGTNHLGGELFLYNFVTGEDEYGEIKIQEPNHSLLSFVHHNESLVSIKRAHDTYQ